MCESVGQVQAREGRDRRRAADWHSHRPEPGNLERVGLTITDLVDIATGPMRELAERFAITADGFEQTALHAHDENAAMLRGMGRGLRLAAASIEDVIEE